MPTPTAADLLAIFDMTPVDAVAYFRKKGFRVPDDYRQMDRDAHSNAFMIAKMTKLDLLSDVYQALADNLAKGGTQQTFNDRVEPIMRAKGWWGDKEFIDQGTGEIQVQRLGSAYRLQTIYETNMQVAYMGGRDRVFDQITDTHPNWQWIHTPQARGRPAHAAMDARIFRFDDPFWGAFSLPCGYKCKCRKVALTDKQAERDYSGMRRSSAGQLSEVTTTHKARDTGDTYQVTRPSYKIPGSAFSITPDIGFQQGGLTTSGQLQQAYLDKLDKAPPAIRQKAEGRD